MLPNFLPPNKSIPINHHLWKQIPMHNKDDLFFFFIIIIESFNNWNGERNLVMRFDNETNFCCWFVFSKLQILDKWLSTFKYHVYTSLDLSNYNWLNLNKYFFFLQYINTVYPLFVFCISTMFVLKKILIFGLRNNTLVLNFC